MCAIAEKGLFSRRHENPHGREIPSSEEEWLKVAQDFENQWHFPQCVGALDGKYIVLQSPINSHGEYINYKKKPASYCLAWWMLIIILCM